MGDMGAAPHAHGGEVPHYEVIVQGSSGQPAPGVKVCLGGTWGMSEVEYTDRSGRAILEHSATTVTVYVNGRDQGRAHPGRFLVTL